MTFNLADTNAPMGIDPSIALMGLLKEKWEIASPSRENVRFDTKWDENSEWYLVIIENVAEDIRQRFLGNGRQRWAETKMIQLYAEDKSSKDKIWKMKEAVKDIINDDVRALQSKGINSMLLGRFNEIRTTVEMLADKGYAADAFSMIQRGYFMLDLYYDRVRI